MPYPYDPEQKEKAGFVSNPPDPQPQPKAGDASNEMGKTAQTPPITTAQTAAAPNADKYKPRQVSEVYDAHTLDGLAEQIQKRINAGRMSDEDIAKLRRRQKAHSIVAGITDAARSIANMFATHNYAPNGFDPTTSMSARAKERFAKEKAEREAKEAERLNLEIQLGKVKGEQQDRAIHAFSVQSQLDQQAKDNEYRDNALAAQVQQHKEDLAQQDRHFREKMDNDNKLWTQQFEWSKIVDQRKLSMEAARLEREAKAGQLTFALGAGENITLPPEKINEETISHIYHQLPDSIRAKVHTEPIYEQDTDDNGNPRRDINGKPILVIKGYADPDIKTMLIAIGANVKEQDAVRDAIRQLAGQKKPGLYD